MNEEAPGTSVGNASVADTPTGKKVVKRFDQWVASRYYQQPDGSWKKGGDSRSTGKTAAQLTAMGVKV